MITPFATFKAKFGLVFVLTETGNAWSFQTLGFILKPRERGWVLLKMVLGVFKIALRLRDRHAFMWQPLKILNVFTTLILKPIWKPFSRNLYHLFLVESTKIESAIFPHKTTLPEANVKANRMRSTKWTYNKERSFASNYFIFLKILFRWKNLF